jgi:hypothetical protein
MFGQALNNLPRLFARAFRKGSHKPLLKLARIVLLHARANKGWNLQQAFAQTFREGCANLRIRIAQTFCLVLRCAGVHFQAIL